MRHRFIGTLALALLVLFGLSGAASAASKLKAVARRALFIICLPT